MGGLDHHRMSYDEESLVKLDLYRKYLQAWLPVFLNAAKLQVTRMQVFDFFAGPGHDIGGTNGSPLIALNAIQEALAADNLNSPEIHLYLNEFSKSKFRELQSVCNDHPIVKTRQIVIHYSNKTFADVFEEWEPLFSKNEADRFTTANLLFLDQNGTKEVNESVFKRIVAAERTDFLFFIASSFIFRFKDQPQNIAGTPIIKSDFDGMTMKTFHRKVCEAYRRWLPKNHEYYLAPFSLAKGTGSNIYGVVFGSGHPAGICKFLGICWAKDGLRGEANYDIDGEGISVGAPMLFEEMNVSSKMKVFEANLEAMILAGNLKTNISVFKYAINNGFLAEHAKSVVMAMIKAKKLPKQKVSIAYDTCGLRKSEPQMIVLGGGK